MQKRQKFLSTDAFHRAASHLKSKARPLEVARFETIFEGAKADDLLVELKNFQNGDGGFGRALEPDFRAQESSVLCTSVGLQIIRFHEIPETESIVRQAIQYFAQTLDRTMLHWRIIPKTAGGHPCAPWWNQEGLEAAFDGFSLNPTAEILGYVLDYGNSIFEQGIVSQLMDVVLQQLTSVKVIEMHDLLCCLRLLETKNLPPTFRGKVFEALRRLISDTVATKPEQWKGYCLRPLQVISNPRSPFIGGLEAAVSLNLNFEIEEQNQLGSWTPTWSWGDRFPEAWAVAEREWTGVLTLEKLITMNRFHRIET